MSKYLSSWSGMRKYLEQDMIAPCFEGRVRYDCTTYPQMDGCSIIRLFIDKKEIKRFSHETVNSYFIKQGIKAHDTMGVVGYWKDYWKLLTSIPITKRTEYTDYEFCDALERYRNQDIQTSIRSEDPLLVMFALFDRRIGKRTLDNLKEQILTQPTWVQDIYYLRIND